jgi:AcrR family transcriptional regulator
MSISFVPEPRANAVLNAALAVFARYGFKRASMEDIALEAGISRPALYLVYPNKGAIFTGLARAMAARACELARAAWPEDKAFATGLSDAALALNLDAWRLVKGSPHGGELMSDNSAVVSQITAEVDAFFVGLIEARLRALGQSVDLARMIAASLHGIKDKAKSEADLIAATVQFSKLVARGSGIDAA